MLEKKRILSSGKDAIYAIIDGKQRLETIWSFIDDGFPLSDDFEFFESPKMEAAGLKYSELALKYPLLKVKFDSKILPVILVEVSVHDLIDEMFSRLNEAVPLNSAEKRNAFGGLMVKVINDVELHPFFSTRVKFANNRYQHKEVAARILFLEKSIKNENKIIDTKKAYLDKFVKEYKENEKNKKAKQNAKKLRISVKKILTNMAKTFNNKDSLLRSQASAAIYYLLFKYAIEQDKSSKITRRKLLRFVRRVRENKKQAEIDVTKANFDLLQYDRLTIQGTNDASSIKGRLHILQDFFSFPKTIFD